MLNNFFILVLSLFLSLGSNSLFATKPCESAKNDFLSTLKLYTPNYDSDVPPEVIANLDNLNQITKNAKIALTLKRSNEIYNNITCDAKETSKEESKEKAKLLHNGFLANTAPHIVILQLQGAFSPAIVEGASPNSSIPDTGGQTGYVGDVARTLSELGYKVTIVANGGWVKSGRKFAHSQHSNGIEYLESFPNVRIVYIQNDYSNNFIRKEDFPDQVSFFALNLINFFSVVEKEQNSPSIIVSNYWDSGVVGTYLKMYYKNKGITIPHYWFTHSLGKEKKASTPESDWQKLRIDERIAFEEYILSVIAKNQEDKVVSTTPLHDISLKDNYGVDTDNKLISFNPGVNTKRFSPVNPEQKGKVWDLLVAKATAAKNHFGKNIKSLSSKEDLNNVNTLFALHYSRTVDMKNQEAAIEGVYNANLNLKKAGSPKRIVLIIALHENPLGEKLKVEIDNMEKDLGSPFVIPFWGGVDQKDVPMLASIASFFLQPAIMEPWGMTPQEFAASLPEDSKAIIISSDNVNSIKYSFMGEPANQKTTAYDNSNIIVGSGGIMLVTPKENGPSYGRHVDVKALGFVMYQLVLKPEERTDQTLRDVNTQSMSQKAQEYARAQDWKTLAKEVFPQTWLPR